MEKLVATQLTALLLPQLEEVTLSPLHLLGSTLESVVDVVVAAVVVVVVVVVVVRESVVA